MSADRAGLNTTFGVPGLLFDQEYGLLAYAPAYVLAGFGLWTMMRRPGALRRLGLEIGVMLAALTFTVGAFRIWWGGSAAPGRPLVVRPAAADAADGRADRIGARRHRPGGRRSTCSSWIGVAVAAIVSRRGWPARRPTAATARRRCSNGCRHAGRCGRWSRPSSPTRPRTALVGSRSGSPPSPSDRGCSPGGGPDAGPGVAVGAGDGRGRRADRADRVRRCCPRRSRHCRRRPARPCAAGGARLVRPRGASLRRALRAGAVRRRARHRADAGGRASRPDCVPSRSRCGCCTTAASRCRPGDYRVRVRWAASDSLPAREPTGDCAAGGPHRPGAAAVAGDAVAAAPVERGVLAAGGRRLRRLPRHRRSWNVRSTNCGSRPSTSPTSASAQPRRRCSRRRRTATRSCSSTTSACTRSRAASGPPAGARVRLTIACPGGCTTASPCGSHSGAATQSPAAGHARLEPEVDLHGETLVAVQVPPVAGGGAIELDLETSTGFVPIATRSKPPRSALSRRMDRSGPAGQEP